MYTAVLTTKKNNTNKTVVVNGENRDNFFVNIAEAISNFFYSQRNHKDQLSVSTLLEICPKSGEESQVCSMELGWNKTWNMWEILYDLEESMVERFISLDAATYVFCKRLYPGDES